MRLSFLGATKTVTGSKYLLQAGGKRILIDCGLFQGYKDLRLKNWDALPFDAKSIDNVILTHAHLDHSGYIPLLIKNGFKGSVFCTSGTFDLCSILLPDSGYLEEEEAKRANYYGYTKHKPALPLYTQADAIHALDQYAVIPYNREINITDELRFKLMPSGHIIGAAFIQFYYHHTSLLFSGDLGRLHHPIMRQPTRHLASDYLVLESTYGDRLHDILDPMMQLQDIILRTISRGGSIIIPAFAVGRTQDILYYLYILKSQKKIPNIPVYLDSPMAQSASNLLIKYIGEHKLDEPTCKQIYAHVEYIKSQDESKMIDHLEKPVIIISASGMATGGRILHHLKQFLPGKNNTIMFTGYQDSGTLGDRIVCGEKTVKIHGEMIEVNADIIAIESLSAHADYEETLEWLGSFDRLPKKIFITHGNLESAISLKQKIDARYKVACVIPDYLYSETL